MVVPSCEGFIISLSDSKHSESSSGESLSLFPNQKAAPLGKANYLDTSRQSWDKWRSLSARV